MKGRGGLIEASTSRSYFACLHGPPCRNFVLLWCLPKNLQKIAISRLVGCTLCFCAFLVLHIGHDMWIMLYFDGMLLKFPKRLLWRWQKACSHRYLSQIIHLYYPLLAFTSSWWFQPIWNIFIVKLDHFPNVRGEIFFNISLLLSVVGYTYAPDLFVNLQPRFGRCFHASRGQGVVGTWWVLNFSLTQRAQC